MCYVLRAEGLNVIFHYFIFFIASFPPFYQTGVSFAFQHGYLNSLAERKSGFDDERLIDMV